MPCGGAQKKHIQTYLRQEGTGSFAGHHPYTVNEDGLLDINNCGSIALQASDDLLGPDCEADGNDAASYLLAIFRCVPKPAYVSRVTMLANEHLIETHSSSEAGAWVRGNDFINKLLLYRSPHIDRLKHLLSTSIGFATADYTMALSHWQLYCEQMEQAIQLDNEAIAQNNTAYWENLSDQVKLRDGFIRDQAYLMAYALYQFNYIETPIYATGQALIQQEITEEQLYSQLNAWTLADQLVYPIVDFVGLIPGVDIGADLVGFFYAQLRGDMQQAPLYAMALMLPPGLDNMAQYGGRGSSHVVAVYTANGITYVPKLADEPIDEAVEAVRASVLTHDPVIAQAIIDADAPYIFHEADELYKSRHSAIYQGTGNDLAKAKLITGEIADHCPLLLANPQLVTKELSEVLAGIPDATKRKAFLEALDGFGDIGKLTTFVEDLANAPELVVALKGRWELVRAWEELYSNLPNHLRHWRTDLTHLDFFSNSDVRNALSWIKTNLPNLFNDYPNLSPGEITALNYYTTPEGNQINYWLRGDGVLSNVEWSPQHADKYLEFLDGAFAKLPHYSSSPTLLRGEIRAFSEMGNWTTGHQLDYPNFISTAKDATGDFFDAGGFSHNVIININNSGNVKAINMEPFSQLDTELEVLLFRGKKLELQAPPTLRRYPDENKVEEWINNSFLSGELDAAGNPIPINPNYGTPDADKILMVDVNVIDQ